MWAVEWSWTWGQEAWVWVLLDREGAFGRSLNHSEPQFFINCRKNPGYLRGLWCGSKEQISEWDVCEGGSPRRSFVCDRCPKSAERSRAWNTLKRKSLQTGVSRIMCQGEKEGRGLFLFCWDQLGRRENLVCVKFVCLEPCNYTVTWCQRIYNAGPEWNSLGQGSRQHSSSLSPGPHSFIHSGATAGSEPCTEVKSRRQCVMGSRVR